MRNVDKHLRYKFHWKKVQFCLPSLGSGKIVCIVSVVTQSTSSIIGHNANILLLFFRKSLTTSLLSSADISIISPTYLFCFIINFPLQFSVIQFLVNSLSVFDLFLLQLWGLKFLRCQYCSTFKRSDLLRVC